MPSPTAVLSTHGGFCTTATLAAAGVSPRSLLRAIDDGEVVRVRRGFYALDKASPNGLRAVRLGGRLAGVSAAATFGLWSGWGDQLHVSVRPHASTVRGKASQRGVRMVDDRPVIVHWNDDRRDTAWCWRVSVDRCLRQVLRWNDAETAVAVIDTALERRFITLDSLPSLAVGPIVPTEAEVLGCRVGAGSGVESIARQRLERLGYQLRLQVKVTGVGPVDMAIAGTRVYVEVDGYEFHRSLEQFAEDRRRDAEACVRGYVPLRFTATQVRDDWTWVERMIVGAVTHGAA